MATQVSLNSGAVASAGALAIQTNGTTQAVSISTGQVATLAQNPILTSGTANGVAYLNGSKAVTSGSALVFDGTNLGVGASPAQTLHVKTSTSTTPITLGVLSNATGLPALSFNGAYASTTMAGIYGNGATASSLYYEVPSGQSHFFGIADSTKMTLNASGNLQTIGTISVGNATPSTSGAGITFPATQSASSDANTLDDYEEGTWTPNIGGTATYSAQTGTYIKVGRIVTVQFHITINTMGTGQQRLFNFPFTTENTGFVQTGVISFFDGLATATSWLGLYMENNSTSCLFVGQNAFDTGCVNAIAIFGNGADIYGTVTYSSAS